jgi:hypothetical protein
VWQEVTPSMAVPRAILVVAPDAALEEVLEAALGRRQRLS